MARRPPATTAPKPPSSVPTSARSIISSLLDQFGLKSLADWAWKTYTGAGGGDVGLQLIQAELPDTAEFKARFPAIAQRTKAGLPAITPAEYLSYETTLRQAFNAHGLVLPTVGHDFNEMIRGLLVNDVSAAEVVNDRIGKAYSRVATAPVEVRQAAERIWGVHGDAALASLFLSPEHSAPELERLSESMSIAGNASRYGINVDAARAGRLADLGAADQLDRLSTLVQMAPLFRENVSETTDLTLENQGLAATFNEDATSQQQVTRRLEERKAAFGGGGGPSDSTKGLGGLGSGPET